MKFDIPEIIIDTREQEPFEFQHPCRFESLKTGDYSIVGMENLVVVERKRHNELIQCFTHERERFQKEIERGESLRRFHVVVEGSFKAAIEGLYEDWPNETNLSSIRGTLAAWQNRYNSLRFHFCGDRVTAQKWTEHLLKKSYLDQVQGK